MPRAEVEKQAYWALTPDSDLGQQTQGPVASPPDAAADLPATIAPSASLTFSGSTPIECVPMADGRVVVHVHCVGLDVGLILLHALMICVVVFASGLSVALLGRVRSRVRWNGRRRNGRCGACGYILRGLYTGRCPECGVGSDAKCPARATSLGLGVAASLCATALLAREADPVSARLGWYWVPEPLKAAAPRGIAAHRLYGRTVSVLGNCSLASPSPSDRWVVVGRATSNRIAADDAGLLLCIPSGNELAVFEVASLARLGTFRCGTVVERTGWAQVALQTTEHGVRVTACVNGVARRSTEVHRWVTGSNGVRYKIECQAHFGAAIGIVFETDCSSGVPIVARSQHHSQLAEFTSPLGAPWVFPKQSGSPVVDWGNRRLVWARDGRLVRWSFSGEAEPVEAMRGSYIESAPRGSARILVNDVLGGRMCVLDLDTMAMTLLQRGHHWTAQRGAMAPDGSRCAITYMTVDSVGRVSAGGVWVFELRESDGWSGNDVGESRSFR